MSVFLGQASPALQKRIDTPTFGTLPEDACFVGANGFPWQFWWRLARRFGFVAKRDQAFCRRRVGRARFKRPIIVMGAVLRPAFPVAWCQAAEIVV